LSRQNANHDSLFWLLAAAGIYILFFHSLDALGLVGPDEPRYAAVARNMAESGDWVTPRLYGQPWLEKPVLYYWLAGWAFRLIGVNETSARLPSAALAATCVLAMLALARRLYGRDAGRWVLLLLPTCAGIIAFARAATPDMPFTAFLALALLSAHGALGIGGNEAKPGGRYAWLLALGASLGAATLAKGPAAVLLAGAGTLLWAALARRWRDALGLLHPVAVASFAAAAAPWYVVCALRNPEFVDEFLLSHNVARFLTPVFQHQQPFWFYGPILLIGLMPWPALLLPAMGEAARAAPEGKWREAPGLLCACWVLVPLIFFSVSQSKLPGYILPVIPALGVLLAGAMSGAADVKAGESALGRAAAAGAGLALAATGIGAAVWAWRVPEGLFKAVKSPMLALAVVAVAAGGAIALAALRGRARIAGQMTAATVVMLVGGLLHSALPAMSRDISPREVANRLAASRAEDVRAWKLHRAWKYGLDFYRGSETPEWQPGAERGVTVVMPEAEFYGPAAKGWRAKSAEKVAKQAWVVRIE
jgi:4-amino-4-deoxy-L-arabinose transferase-like glycosyltransferase